MNDMRTSKNGLEFIARWEGVVLHPYMDVASLWTIGVGHLIRPGDCFSSISNDKVKELLASKDRDHPYAELLITREEALDILAEDVTDVESYLNAYITVPLNQDQYDALVSFGFNCGPGVFKTSGACKALNAGDYEKFPEKLLDWSKVRVNGSLQVNKGLLARRKAEGELFSKQSLRPEDPHEVPTIVSWNKEIMMDTQTRLKMLGLYPGLIDGIMGPKTRAAIEHFSRTHAISPGVDPRIGVTPMWLSALAAAVGG